MPGYVKAHDDDERLRAIPGAVAMNNVMRECAEEMINKDSDEWAHRLCIQAHVCFSLRYRAKVGAWEREQAVQRAAGPNPLDDLE